MFVVGQQVVWIIKAYSQERLAVILANDIQDPINNRTIAIRYNIGSSDQTNTEAVTTVSEMELRAVND